jgi:hypothetical protein
MERVAPSRDKVSGSPALVAVILALVAVSALAAHSMRASHDGAPDDHMHSLAVRSVLLKNALLGKPAAKINKNKIQQLVSIPGGDSLGSAVPHSPSWCTLPGVVVQTSPPSFYCVERAGSSDAGSVDNCNDCTSGCLSPDAAMGNRDITGQDGDTFVGWNPQGGPTNNENQYIDVDLGGKGATVMALLWANAGDTDHDPANIKLSASDDGVNYELVKELDVSGLQGDGNITVIPTDQTDVRAKFWRIQPGGIEKQSIPRVIGLCNTPDCSECEYEDRNLPEQGYNVYKNLRPADCYESEPNGGIYCGGKYDGDEEFNKALTKSYTIPIYRKDGYKR